MHSYRMVSLLNAVNMYGEQGEIMENWESRKYQGLTIPQEWMGGSNYIGES